MILNFLIAVCDRLIISLITSRESMPTQQHMTEITQ